VRKIEGEDRRHGPAQFLRLPAGRGKIAHLHVDHSVEGADASIRHSKRPDRRVARHDLRGQVSPWQGPELPIEQLRVELLRRRQLRRRDVEPGNATRSYVDRTRMLRHLLASDSRREPGRRRRHRSSHPRSTTASVHRPRIRGHLTKMALAKTDLDDLETPNPTPTPPPEETPTPALEPPPESATPVSRIPLAPSFAAFSFKSATALSCRLWSVQPELGADSRSAITSKSAGGSAYTRTSDAEIGSRGVP